MEKDTNYYNQLAKRALNDDVSFIELYETFFKRVYNFIYSKIRNAADTDEVVNDVFYKVFMNLEQYSGTSPFTAWLFSTANHSIIDYYRRKNKKRQIVTEDWEEFFIEAAPEFEQPENKLLTKEETRQLLDAVGKLNEREQEIIKLKYWADCSNVEIAEILNLTSSNVGIILFRALDKLKKLFVMNE